MSEKQQQLKNLMHRILECALVILSNAWMGVGVGCSVTTKGTKSGKQRALSANIKLWCQKNSRSEAKGRFWLPYFSPRQTLIKLIVQGGNTDK